MFRYIILNLFNLIYFADTENIQAHIYIHGILTDVKIIKNMEDAQNLDKAKIRKINE